MRISPAPTSQSETCNTPKQHSQAKAHTSHANMPLYLPDCSCSSTSTLQRHGQIARAGSSKGEVQACASGKRLLSSSTAETALMELWMVATYSNIACCTCLGEPLRTLASFKPMTMLSFAHTAPLLTNDSAELCISVQVANAEAIESAGAAPKANLSWREKALLKKQQALQAA